MEKPKQTQRREALADSKKKEKQQKAESRGQRDKRRGTSVFCKCSWGFMDTRQ